MSLRITTICLVCLLLVVAIFLNIGGVGRGSYVSPKKADLRRHLDGIVNISNWKPVPLGNTELLEVKTKEVLQFDEYFYAESISGARRITLLVLFWEEGTMDFGMASYHTPDICWVGNGMKMVEARHGSRYLSPVSGEYRKFEKGGEVTQTVFWQIVRGYNATPTALRGGSTIGGYIRDFLNLGVVRNGEQFFIRVAWDGEGDLPPEAQQLAASLLKGLAHNEDKS